MRKKNIRFLASLLLLLGVAGLSSCSDSNSDSEQDVDIPVISGVTDPVNINVIAGDSGSISWHDHFSAMQRDAEAGNGPEDKATLAFAKRQLFVNDSLTNAYIDEAGGNGEHGADGVEGENNYLGYKYVNIRYQSVDKDNKPIQLSELLIFPYNKIYPDAPAANIIIGCHITISSNKERPSNYGENSFLSDVGMLACHAMSTYSDPSKQDLTNGSGNLVIIPDYQGYGASSGDAHPYLYQTLTARQVVDGVIAGRKWYEENGGSLHNGYKTYAVGYSQGGSVAMAVQRYVEQNGLSDNLQYAGSVCGDGPYDPMATIKKYVADDKIYMPVALGLIIKGMCDANPYVVGKYQPSDFFTDAFIKSGMMDWIASKDFPTDVIQTKLLEYSWKNANGFVMMRKDKKDGKYYEYTDKGESHKWVDASEAESAYCTVDQILRPEAIAYIKTGKAEAPYADKLAAIEKALEMNNLCKGWVPSHPIFVFHSLGDEVVPFANYESASQSFTDSNFIGMKYKATAQSHTGTGQAFFLLYEKVYLTSLMGNHWTKIYPAHDNWQYSTLFGL